MNYYLGIDTSAYTSSLAVVDESGQIFCDNRMVLEVPPGKRGLKQSEALFLHTKNLPQLIEKTQPDVFEDLRGIAVSAFPRPVQGSYMPVFLCGDAHARALAAAMRLPLYRVSHQEGHIMAGMADNQELLGRKELLAVHFSGGTSEILHVRRGEKNYFDIDCTMAGRDLHAGQLVDRVGVALGLKFPAGKALEKLADGLTVDHEIPVLPAAVSRRGFSFSGVETRAQALIAGGAAPEAVAFAVFRVIANTLEKCLLQESEKAGIKDVLLVGGVMANQRIKERLRTRLEHPAVGLKLYFAQPVLSTDNAVGTAMLAAIIHKDEVSEG